MRNIPPEPCPVCGEPSACIADATLIQKPHIFECETHGMFEDGKLTRKRKVCIRCGHAECPCCCDWCDTMVDDGDGDRDLCCDGECVYEETPS